MFSSELESVSPDISETFVKVVAESINVQSLSDDVCHDLVDDLNCRIKQLVEVARKFAIRGKRSKLRASDFDRALRVKNIEPLYGFNCPDGIPFRFASGGGRNVFFAADNQLDIQNVINQNVPKAPPGPQLKAHWLAVDGVQPAIPENPAPSALEPGTSDARSNKSRIGPKLRKTEIIQVRPIAPHQLSLEQQFYYKEITEASVGSDERKRAEALQSLATDTGLNPLLPRLALFIAEGVKCSAIQHNMALLIYLMRMIKSLTDNPTVSLEKQLHELCPAMVTCIVSKQLCIHPNVDNHWALREFSCRLLVTLCKMYGTSVASLHQRVVQVMANAIDNIKDSCLNSVYGSLYCINELGVEAVKTIIIPRCKSLGDRLRPIMEKSFSVQDRKPADQCHKILTKAVVSYVQFYKPANLQDVNDFRNEFGFIGPMVLQDCDKTPSRSTSRIDMSRPNTPSSLSASSRATESPNVRPPSASIQSKFPMPLKTYQDSRRQEEQFRFKEETID